MIRRYLLVATLAALLAGIALAAPPASAGGGSWMEPVLDRYSPGEVATMVGYVGPTGRAWVDDGPFDAYLRPAPRFDLPAEAQQPPPPGQGPLDIPLGPLILQETGWPGYSSLRVSITFTVPDVAPGSYSVEYCNADCTWLGDLIGGSLWVDVDPPVPLTRPWPLEDPARAGAAADVPLPPPPPTTLPPAPTTPTTGPPGTTGPAAVTSTTEDPTTSPVRNTTEAADQALATSSGSGGAGASGPGWLLVGLGVGILVLALVAAKRSRWGTHSPVSPARSARRAPAPEGSETPLG